MRVIESEGVRIEVDEEGYLVNLDDWNDSVAVVLARREGIGDLGRDRMDVIKFMRDYYKQYKAFPLLRGVCRRVHQSKDCYSEKFIDPLKAWKIAGLPKPDEHVISEMRGEGGVG
ncbi:MAG TPA: sulfur relay protein DsrC [Nitrospiraceae bacterium]|jgi:TusE/DsrC/DsvC family sulfur relay protein|nr:sulfur relay protein DsrC [Nitrospiraceae bacterium]